MSGTVEPFGGRPPTPEEMLLVGERAKTVVAKAEVAKGRLQHFRGRLEVKRSTRNLRTTFIPLDDPAQIPENMTEKQARRFWDIHEVTEEYLRKTTR